MHTYSGHENKVKVNLEKLVENRGMQDLILEVIVPHRDRVEITGQRRGVKTRKIFPGYVIVKMIVTNEVLVPCQEYPGRYRLRWPGFRAHSSFR